MKFPRLICDLNKIKKNAKIVVSLAKRYNISVTGITKVTCGNPNIAKAMVSGGVKIIGDSRIENIKRLKKEKIDTRYMLIRSPMISEIADVIKYADISLNTELSVIKKLSNFAKKKNKRHKVILMVEMGDLREGILKEELSKFIDETLKFPNIELYGIGMNHACYGGVIPTQEKIEEFEDIVIKMERDKNISFQMVSGGNSSIIPLLISGMKSKKINDIRIGEGIILGRETVNRKAFLNSHQDTFLLEGEIIELKDKPSLPSGQIGQDAFGNIPSFKDYGVITRALLALGRQDTIFEDLITEDGLEILGASSDHLILYLKNRRYKVGDKIKFNLKYGALLRAFTSKYVKKIFVDYEE
ncbi:MAG: hypothetical protein AMS24_00410 [Chlamydiae bacterium SM23_39]|nr:MAG: hypothetical protein AMS24_00410 [Chlamydiae bacterium SM23_39]